MRGGPSGQGEYASGQTAGLIFAGIFFIVGLFYLVKGGGRHVQAATSTSRTVPACEVWRIWSMAAR